MNDEEEPPLLHAFMGYGIELEYMIVDRDSLSVLPVADKLLQEASGHAGGEVARGRFGWSNELVMHVVEVKNLRPTTSLSLLPDAFHAELLEIERLLQPMNARLMPGAMHPWMDPLRETRLWPHDNEAIYRAYDRIFDSRSHGWANLQSMHINLPFGGDSEFERLHAAVRLVLPILPALAASSPIADGGDTGWDDYRMHVYCDNARAIPSIAGQVVPETVTSRAAYEERILAPMYRDIAPHDPEQVLQHEWLNSRGAIARFDRNAIEIRVVDTQECPRADLAIAAATVEVVRMLYDTDREGLAAQQEMTTGALAAILQACIRDAEQAEIADARYLRLFGMAQQRCSAGELWRHLVGQMMVRDPRHRQHWLAPLTTMLEHGPLARRILHAARGDFSRERLQSVYRQLCDCLRQNRMFADPLP
ncbi:MAG TPA: glutamate-cysteine ligase family protein [Noviherbaspirillum sp.]|uniref:carboxylate-amine ligase n=1 Tax=Noviherbaspirillum sp. TaxID=1926288 RepID=UPI002D62518E|nr:glutamate-cysteine ligase family protein [Noviherbaspirillum sp.]HYD94906.1 glutamate-cysteine ligase family protein [Noviherbaspirillum sp.]